MAQLGRRRFLLEAGAEILLETARFWASRALPEADGHCHIRGIIGPDENHEHIDDNAFTNVMARWNIRRALRRAACCSSVGRSIGRAWPRGSASTRPNCWTGPMWPETIAIGFDPKTGMYEQFAGFFDLEDIDLSPFADRAEPVEV